MKRLLVLCALFTFASIAAAQTAGRYIVGTRHPSLQGAREILTNELEPRSFRTAVPFESIDGFAVDLLPDEVTRLRHSPNVRYVELDQVVHALADTIVPGTETIPFGVSMINAPAVWPYSKGGGAMSGMPTVHIAIIDTGIAYQHPELVSAFRGGWNEFTQKPDPLDDNGHGTHVAGTIAAAQDGSGVVGVAPQADIYSIKVLDSCGSGQLSKIVPGDRLGAQR